VSALGNPRVHLRRTGSTNDRARELALAGAPHGTLVTAAEQTAGRGRQGRTWSAPPGSALLMSLLLRWSSPEQAPLLLPLAAGVAVCEVAGDGAQVKWPNDVVIVTERPGRAPVLAKLAGVLTEARPQELWAVLGIGVNVAVELERLPPELGPAGERPAATLGLDPSAIEPTLARLLEALERRLGEPSGETLEAWRGRDALRGRRIDWSGGSGRAEGVDGAGRLIVALDSGARTTLGSGEVHLHQRA